MPTAVNTAVLVTKLFIPRPRTTVVSRPRLNERLQEGLHRSLTLIAAPAGFGKTTLLSQWVAACGRPTAWLSVDNRDNDPTRFLMHLVAAVQTIAPSVGDGVVNALQSSQPPSTDVVLAALLNDVATLPEDFILVLDDYHLIDAEAVDAVLTFVLEHVPPQLHLLVATREDPQLPLARLRARGELTELRAADLRFTPSEAADFLNHVMDLDLLPQDIEVLEKRTEGWIAGLQLAALSLQGGQDASRFIRGFAGDHRYIADYLVEEVLRRQPEEVRSFLLRTSILDRLSGPLCDAVTGRDGGGARLEALERGNYFVVPLDDRRHWYRYHHLFADVLSAHLTAEQPDLVPKLHRCASEWYEHHGSAADAIHHALDAEDFERAANLIEPALRELRRARQEPTVLGWLRAIPDEVFHRRPVLSAMYAGALLSEGELEDVEVWLREAERWLDPTTDKSEMVVVDDEEFCLLPGTIAVWRAGLALVLGDVAAATSFAMQALNVTPEDDHFGRGSAAGLLGLALWASGDLETGHRWYSECRTRIHRAGYLSDVLGCTMALADMRIAQGRLREAMSTYELALKRALEQGEPVLAGTADMYVGMSALRREQNDLTAATQLVLRSEELGVLAGKAQNPYRSCVALARIREAEGDLDGALALLQEAERLYVGDFFPNVRPVPAMKARVWAVQGKVREALDWARERGLSPNDDLSYLREFEHITLARVLLARYRSDLTEQSFDEALSLLERLLQAAEEGERTGGVIEILVLQALTRHAHGDMLAALGPLERALRLAEPEGYVRVFVDEGPPMARLLREVAARGIMPTYSSVLLAAFNSEQRPLEGDPLLPATPASRPLIEPLSDRELDVLRLLNSELSGPEIATELVVALSTVRTHTKRIYQKLDVTTRRAAVNRASALGLI